MTDDDFTQPDPHDLAAEQAVLGAMMLSEAAAAACLQALVADDFYRPAHQIVFEAVKSAANESTPADAIALRDRLEAAGDLGRIGRADYLHTLVASVPTVANAGYYAGIVRDKACSPARRRARPGPEPRLPVEREQVIFRDGRVENGQGPPWGGEIAAHHHSRGARQTAKNSPELRLGDHPHWIALPGPFTCADGRLAG